jgi:cell division transport system permease protein
MNVGAYFDRQAQTLVGSLGRIAEAPVAFLMTMTVIGIAVALPLCLYVFLQNARQAVAGWNDAFELSVYLSKSTTPERTGEIAAQIRSRTDVASVRVILAPQALAEFRRYSGFGDALDALRENPLPNTLVVTPTPAASTAAGTAALRTALRAVPDVDQVQLDTQWVQRLIAIVNLLRRVVWLAAGLLGLGVALIVGNTIRLDIQSRRAEIEVMKLVGASDRFARRPFLYAGLWYGAGGGVLALLLVAIAVAWVSGPVSRLAHLYGSGFALSGIGFKAGGVVLLASALLGWIGAWIAATQHIRAINPS